MLGPDCLCPDDHPFQHRVGIAFKDRAIHKGAWVTLVGIAEHILGASCSCSAKLPLQARRKAGPAAASETGGLHLFNNLFRRHLEEGFGRAHITIPCDILVYVVRVDKTPVLEGNKDLATEKADLINARDCFSGFGTFKEMFFYHTSLDKVFLHKVGDIVHC